MLRHTIVECVAVVVVVAVVKVCGVNQESRSELRAR